MSVRHIKFCYKTQSCTRTIQQSICSPNILKPSLSVFLMAFFQGVSPSTITAIKQGVTFIIHERRSSAIPCDHPFWYSSCWKQNMGTWHRAGRTSTTRWCQHRHTLMGRCHVKALYDEFILQTSPDHSCLHISFQNSSNGSREAIQWRTERGGVGVFKPPPPRNSEDIGGVLDHISKKNRHLDFHL